MIAKVLLFLVAIALVPALAAGPAVAVDVINTDTAITDTIPGVAAFTVTGDMMDGMLVTAVFNSGFTQTLAWADIAAGTGGVSGTNWSLTASNDTFDDDAWTFSNTRTGAFGRTDALLRLTLNGAPGLTLFDRSAGFLGLGVGTVGSSIGKDFAEGLPAADSVATYRHQVAVGANAPVGDLWHELDIEWANGVSAESFTFTVDTDNDVRASSVPEPGSMLLIGTGLVALASLARRRR